MAMSTEDRAWLEQRLQLHLRAIEAQFEKHHDKLLVAVEPRRRAARQRSVCEEQADDVYIPPENSVELHQQSPNGPSKWRKASQSKKSGLHAEETPQNRNANVTMSFSALPESKTVSIEEISTPPETPGGRPRSTLHHLIEDETGYWFDPRSMRGRLAVFLNTYMTSFINFCVLANTVTMFVQLQWLGNVANVSLGLVSPGAWSNAENIFSLLEYIFTTIFCVDLLLQLFAFRLHYFSSNFNIMDALIVAVTSLEVFILTPLASSFGNVAVARLVRLAKLARAVKAARTIKSFEGLRVLVATMFFSVGSIFWSLVILFVFQIMGSIFMCHSLHDFVVDPSKDRIVREWVNGMYGDGVKSFWTIFELTFSGCWPNYARRIIEEVSPLYSFFYFLYVYIVVFVATRIVAALFMKETLSQYAKDADMMVKERTKKSAWIKQTLTDLFAEADTNDDGFLSTDELRAFLGHHKVQVYLKELGVDASEVDTFIDLLENGDSRVNRAAFVYGISRLRGEARSQDLIQVFNIVMRIHDRVKVLNHSMNRIAKDLAKLSAGTPFRASAGEVHV